MYVNVQSVLPSMGEGDVPRVCFGFPFFCVNRIKCCKVSNAALCGTCIWQLKYNFYFVIAWEGKVTQGETYGCTLGHPKL